MENDKTLWNKTTNELTVGDAVKLNVAVLAIMAATSIGIAIGLSAWEKVADRRLEKKAARKSKLTAVQ